VLFALHILVSFTVFLVIFSELDCLFFAGIPYEAIRKRWGRFGHHSHGLVAVGHRGAALGFACSNFRKFQFSNPGYLFLALCLSLCVIGPDTPRSMPPKESFITIVHHEGESVGRIDWSNGAAPAGRQKQRAGAESGHLDQDRGTPIAAPAMLFCPAAPWRGQKRGFFSLKFWLKNPRVCPLHGGWP